MIKLLLGSALLALSAAEADPQLLYGAGLPYVAAAVGAVPHVPVVKSDVLTAAEVEHEVTAHAVPVAVGYHGLGYGYHYGKRSADAEPEADADAYYGHYGYGLGYRGYRGYYGYPPPCSLEPAVWCPPPPLSSTTPQSSPTPLI